MKITGRVLGMFIAILFVIALLWLGRGFITNVWPVWWSKILSWMPR